MYVRANKKMERKVWVIKFFTLVVIRLHSKFLQHQMLGVNLFPEYKLLSSLCPEEC